MEFWRTKTYDLLAASPLIVLYGLGSWGLWIQATAAIQTAAKSGSSLAALDAGTFLVSLAFIAFEAVLFTVRRTPQTFSTGWLPRAVALAGANVSTALLLLPRSSMPPALHVVSGLLVVAGAAGSIWVLSYLGRAFAVMPQARQLTLQGPYAVVRHPLYLFELIGLLGAMLQFRQPWALMIVAVTFAFQLMRMSFEERVLSQTFPAYAPYAARTARLIPHVY
ncbi:MAG: isoprenylcysteine carboxylmethyltransferase family protein [Alphaproteobacteria bacterium]|nr:isoprenylcysteine carboxylmethyltransferase family protein [Alphaproteobacteria bacterium]MBL7097448.1 isoprenylcysteine carboxylmethyltransferase family protein [Alphaproteobacteria bacterium]